jgi:DNA topoisomerase VI subunit A
MTSVTRDQYDTAIVLDMIRDILNRLGETLEDGLFPEIGYFASSKRNVEYEEEKGYTARDEKPSFLDGRKAESAKTLAGLVYGLTQFKEHLEHNMSMSLRDFYYVHKVKAVQDVLRIKDQNETNRMINLCERVLRISGESIPREEFGVVSSPKGTFYGDVTLSDLSGKKLNCAAAGEYGWFISSRPHEVVIHDINIDASLLVEKEAMARNLIELGIAEELNLGIGALFGQPGRNMRAWIRKLSENGVPILVLVDMSPWSLRIFSTIKSNSIELANIGGLATPKAKLLGLTTDDFWSKNGMLREIEHSLEQLGSSDKRCAKQNKNIPAIEGDPVLKRENEVILKKGRKGELEAFKAFGLPLTKLKDLYKSYIISKARAFDVKLI